MIMNRERTACFSGYRPHKFDFPLSGNEYDRFTARVYDAIVKIIDEGYVTFIVGMSAGFDIIAAELVILAKCVYTENEINLICALPYENFKNTEHFDNHWRVRYNSVVEQGNKIINVTNEPYWTKGCYGKRNRFMVDNSSLLICYFIGQGGGTENTVKYAKDSGIRIENIANSS